MNNSIFVSTNGCIFSFDTSNIFSFEFFLGAIFIPIICIFGIVGNSVIIYVLSDKKFSINYTYNYLFYLACIQFITITFQTLLMITIPLMGVSGSFGELLALFTSHVVFPIYNSGTTLSLMITVIYTVERCLFVKRVRAVQDKRETVARAKLITILVSFIVLTLNVPRAFFFDYKATNDEGTNYCLISRWCLSRNSDWFKSYSMVRFLLFNIGSVCVLAFFNCILLMVVCRHEKQFLVLSSTNLSSTIVTTPKFQRKATNERRSSSPASIGAQRRRSAYSVFGLISNKRTKSPTEILASRARHQRTLTITVVCATFLVLICEIYIAIFNPISESLIWGKLGLGKDLKRILRSSPFIAYAIEYSGNVFVYYIFNSQFRRKMLKKLAIEPHRPSLGNNAMGSSNTLTSISEQNS